jgi:UDP-N-acetylglucosamine/UDP-N-acetylgalactosamine diphosphorylase
MALEEWYRHVRRRFFDVQEFGYLMYEGLIDKLDLAKAERMKRLQVLSEKAKPSSGYQAEKKQNIAGRNEFFERFTEIEKLFTEGIKDDAAAKYRDDFLSAFDKAVGIIHRIMLLQYRVCRHISLKWAHCGFKE